MVTAPLPDSVSVQKKKILSIQVSVGPDGEVVVNSPEPQPKETLGYMATDLFPTPTNPSSVVRKNRSGAAVYCGTRLIAEQSIDEAFPTDQLVELDPLTLEVKIVLAQVTAGSVIEGCSSKAVTLSSQPNSRDVLHSVALGG
jgi:hypothetical protein